MLQDLSIKEFLNRTAGNDPVPGGGSISALCGTLASALAEMVTGLTIGRKKYVDVEEEMKEIAPRMAEARDRFLNYIDEDAQAYDKVFAAFKLPKETEEEKAARHEAIQRTTMEAALVPLNVARLAVEIMDDIVTVAAKGNRNAITDACVAMMTARTAAFGAILNVRINISSLDDREAADSLAEECDNLHDEADMKESALLDTLSL